MNASPPNIIKYGNISIAKSNFKITKNRNTLPEKKFMLKGQRFNNYNLNFCYNNIPHDWQNLCKYDG